MSTRSRIGIVREDGTVRSIYCHFDGYPSHHAVILKNHYNTKVAVEELLNLGDLIGLGELIGVKHDCYDNTGDYKGYCKAFGRDRGDEDTGALFYNNVEEFLGDGEEYNYLFQDNAWIIYKGTEKI
jgi:hypothetical protein